MSYGEACFNEGYGTEYSAVARRRPQEDDDARRRRFMDLKCDRCGNASTPANQNGNMAICLHLPEEWPGL